MNELMKAKEPFRFYARMHLTELTGLKASTLSQLLALIKEVPGACIYHHTHRFLQQHQYLSPEPPNDFAYWVSQVLGEGELAEKLSSIDTIRYSAIRDLRNKISETIEEHLKIDPLSKLKFARQQEEFHFVKTVSFILPTNYLVYDLREFVDALKKVTIDSLYFHIFEARLRLEKGDNDFSNWVEKSVGDKELAFRTSGFDPYSYTLEGLRNILVNIIESRISTY